MAISFKCECGKTLRVKDEFGGKKVKCPACSQIITAPTISSPEMQSPNQCLTCGAGLKEGDLICLKCGTIRQVQVSAEASKQDEAVMPFYKKPLLWVVVALLVTSAIFGYNNFIKKSDEEESTTNSDTKQVSPEKLLQAELKNGNVTNLDKLVEDIINLGDKSLGIIGSEIRSNETAVKLKSLYAVYLLAYFKCYRPRIFTIIDSSTRLVIRDEEIRHLILETLYLLATDEREMALLRFSEVADKYTDRFKQIEQSPAVHQAKDSILKGFTQDPNPLIKAKAFIYLVVLGDRWNIKPLINMMRNSSPETSTFIRNALIEITGFSFERPEEWDKWYSGNRSFSQVRWLINSIEKSSDPQRLQTIKKLVRITGKDGNDFSYSEDATEDDKKEIINKWKQIGKTIK